MQPVVELFHFGPYSRNIFLRRCWLAECLQLFLYSFYPSHVRRNLWRNKNDESLLSAILDKPTFCVLDCSSSTLICRAAEACLYSSKRWYAAQDDARENPKRNPTILCVQWNEVRLRKHATKINLKKHSPPVRKPHCWLEAARRNQTHLWQIHRTFLPWHC